jgi:carotenoid 1,2-hydratase
MPTIPLYAQPENPDDAHHVRAPGGYEWWYFDAEDERHDRRLVVVLFDGFAFHPRYLRRYARYRRHPTRVAPPLPEQYPCASVHIYEQGELRSHALSLAAAPSRVMTRLGDGVEVRVSTDKVMARLLFAPRHPHPPMELSLGSPLHRWILADPLSTVDVEVHCERGRSVTFTGRGYRDHQYGTAPYALDAARWFRGRVLFDEAAYAFHVVRNARGHTDAARLVEATVDRLAEIPVTRASCDWSRKARPGVTYPHAVALDETLHLHNPRVIDSSAFHARLVYDAVCRGARCGQALCDAVHPARLRHPIVGRMIERTIDRLAVQTASSGYDETR